MPEQEDVARQSLVRRLSRSSRPVRWASLAAACLLALPLPLGVFAGFHLRLSPFLALQALLSRAPLSLLMLPAGAVLLLIVWRERWFCFNLCPTGALCDTVSSCRKKPRSWDKIPQINKALLVVALAAAACGAPLVAIIDPLALFHSAWSPLYQGFTIAATAGMLGLALLLAISLLFPRLWCMRLCPLGGMQALVADVCRALRRKSVSRPAVTSSDDGRKPEACSTVAQSSGLCPRKPEACATGGPVLGRRSLFAAIAGVTGGLILRRAEGSEKPAALRPPGALPADRFSTTCCRCGNCTRVCPTRIIRPASDLQDPLGLLAPRLNFSEACCLPTCAACGQVCPTGAIAPFSVDDKKRLFIGTAVIDLDGCLLTQGNECNRCVESCAYEAVQIAGGLFESKPEIDISRCVGCGACVAVCPGEVIEVRPAPSNGAEKT